MELLYSFVKHHKTMEAGVELSFARGGCYRKRLNREGGLRQFKRVAASVLDNG